ncbi:MAG: hypothetical protein GF408_04300 [Candidatus Omnitrophica bacterium]|nr:hypothetical protein [Candidatus Omnitrophota bacterium]
MQNVRPIFIKALIAAVAVFVIGISVMISDLYIRYERVRHYLLHGH